MINTVCSPMTGRELVVPTVHLNGTSRGELLRQIADAYTALGKALDAMALATPHGRDCYVQGEGATERARADHSARVAKVAEVRDELLTIGEAL